MKNYDVDNVEGWTKQMKIDFIEKEAVACQAGSSRKGFIQIRVWGAYIGNVYQLLNSYT